MRALIQLALGLLAGLVATVLLLGGAGEPFDSVRDASWVDDAAEPASRAAAPDTTPTIASRRLAAYRAAAAIADAAVLEAALARAVADAPAASVELEIDAPLARLAELDPARAARAAIRLELAEQYVVHAFHAWARADFDAAASEASKLGTDLRRHVLLGIVEAAADERTSVARVAAALPEAARESFFVDWVVRLAERDSVAAFREALALGNDDAQARAVLRIAAVWARRDPVGALGHAAFLPEYLRADFRRAVSEAWAQVDAAGLLDFLATSPDVLDLGRAAQWLPAADPVRTLAVARALPQQNNFRSALETLALRGLIRRDPDAMLAEVRAMPPGGERESLLREVAMARGQVDLVSSVVDQINVLQSTVPTDPKRLIEMLEELPPNANAGMMVSTLVSNARGTVPKAELADVLLAWDDTRSAQAVGTVLSAWLPDDPAGAVDWLVANGGKLNTRMLTSIVGSFASRDAAAAAAQVDRLPASLRDDWISAVAIPYMRSDPSATLEWLGQFRSQPIYEQTLGRIATVAADRHPRMVAQLIAQTSAGLQLEAAPSVAVALAGLDVAEAARWAQTLSAAPAREQAILTLVPSLARSNPAEARRLVETYVSDPTQRQRALAIVERAAGR